MFIMSKKMNPVEGKQADEQEKRILNSDFYLRTHYHASTTLGSIHGSLDLGTTIEQLTISIDRIIDGKTTEIEAMLITQAKVLEYAFYDAVSRMYTAEMEHAEIYGNMALRAQNQSRKTLLALAELKNPRRAMFIKQQNNAVTQQVNNTTKPESNDFENLKKVANELLEVKENEQQWMDVRAQETAVTTHSSLETVEPINGIQNSRRSISK